MLKQVSFFGNGFLVVEKPRLLSDVVHQVGGI